MFGVNELKKIFMLVLGLVAFGIILNIFTGEEQQIVTEDTKINIINEEKKATDDMARTLYISLEFNSLVEDINTTTVTSELLPRYKKRIDNIKSVIDQDDNDVAWNESAKEELDKILKSVKLRELTERMAQRRNTSTGEALKVILHKLGVKATELADGINRNFLTASN